MPINVLRKQYEVAFRLYADCVEVTGSHVGLIVDCENYRAVARAGDPRR